MSMWTKAFSGDPSPTRKCSRRSSRVRTATGSAMPEAMAAAWISSTRRCGVISFSMLAEYSTITCGMASSRRFDGLVGFPHVDEPVSRVKARNFPLKLASFSAKGRMSYGLVVSDGIVDLAPLLKYASVLDLLRAGALDEA